MKIDLYRRKYFFGLCFLLAWGCVSSEKPSEEEPNEASQPASEPSDIVDSSDPPDSATPTESPINEAGLCDLTTVSTSLSDGASAGGGRGRYSNEGVRATSRIGGSPESIIFTSGS